MTKRTLITLYALALLVVGLLIYALGGAFAGIESFADRPGAPSFVSVLQAIGVSVGLPGVGGLAWAVTLSDNPRLSGYAGLTGPAFTFFLVLLLVTGLLGLLVGWALWLVPGFRADPSPVRQ